MFKHLKNILLLLALFSIPIVIGVSIWLIWFGPGIEEEAKFPNDPHGVFTQSVVMRIDERNILAQWVIPVVCKTNGIELQEEDHAGEYDWMGATASCVQEEAGVTCQVDLSDSELLKGVVYRLQVYNSQCENENYYIGEVTTFSL